MRLGAVPGGRFVLLEPIEDPVGPEAFEPVQRLVEHFKLVGVDAPDLLDCVHMVLVERNGVAHALSVTLMRTERRSTRDR
jgi:hypothetical protein